MKAIILNSGLGRRMGELTKKTPKCLLTLFAGETILSRQINALLENNISEILITTGPFADQIKNYLYLRYPDLNFVFVHNPRYKETNYIYSLYLTRELIDQDVLLMHGDLVFEKDVLKKLLLAKRSNVVLIKDIEILPLKDFKAIIIDGKIIKIAVDLFGKHCYFLLPMYLFSLQSFQKWMQKIEEFCQMGKLQSYAEEALNTILNDLPLYPVKLNDDSFCMEVDDPSDLQVAREHFALTY